MRVFQIIESGSNIAVSGSRTWYRNLYEPLVEMGHDVFLVPAEEGRRAIQRRDAAARAVFSQRILKTFKAEHSKKPFDLFFSYLMDGMVDPAIIDEIRRKGIPTCNFSCNNTHQFDLVDELALHFDYNLHSEGDAARKFRAIGATPLWFPMAANPKYYHPYDVPRAIDVAFVGQNYALRPNYVWHLLKNGIDVHVFGPGWLPNRDKGAVGAVARWVRRSHLLLKALVAFSPPRRHYLAAQLKDLDFAEHMRYEFGAHLHHPISDEEMIRKYSESKISLGFLEVYDHHNSLAPVKQHLHLREFEAPMSGALYFTGYCEELTHFYEPDREVVVYRSEHELLDKTRYYLTHPEEAEAVRRAGRRRALAEHSYHRRFETLLGQLGISQSNSRCPS